ncbi:MAG: VOC family protein [Gammaproteobacteria bacterium]|nr:VOC family protein [Gammaproteobacteria bacterium]MDH3751848.1 VOC family protein [Gammaproteobacteria bacterium]MDH3804484.1 VOC family protein [Gammaproteobacteria bacterium]
MTVPHLYRVILPVSDIGLAAKFYGYVFQDDGQRVSPGRHYFDCDGVILACYDPSADGDDVGQGWLHHENQYLYFSVSDLVAVRDRIEKGGGRNLTEIESMPWGERVFYALDPLGSRLSFVDASTLFTGSE